MTSPLSKLSRRTPEDAQAAAITRRLAKLHVGEHHDFLPGLRVTKDAASAKDRSANMSFRVLNIFPLLDDLQNPDYRPYRHNGEVTGGRLATGLSAEQTAAKLIRHIERDRELAPRAAEILTGAR